MSTSRILATATLSKAAVRRRRKSDGGVFAVAQLTDRDRLDPRIWVAFANDLAIIEQLEDLRVGEPLAVVGPFSATPRADGVGVDWKITVESILTTKRRPKGKKTIAKEERVRSEAFERAPRLGDANAPSVVPQDDREALNDPLPW